MTRIRPIFVAQTAIVVVCTILLMIMAPNQVMGFVAGSLLMTINFGLLTLLWSRMFGKKAVATTFVIVVFKYAILGMLLYFFVRVLKLPLVALFAGISTLFGSIVLAALVTQKD